MAFKYSSEATLINLLTGIPESDSVQELHAKPM